MNPPPTTAAASSTRPYLIRALHEWCSDNGLTHYLAVSVDATVRVPMDYVRNAEIVLNVGLDATSGLTLGNERIEFKARFGGVARDISVPVDRVLAIYARENGQGIAFPVAPAPVQASKPAAVPPDPLVPAGSSGAEAGVTPAAEVVRLPRPRRVVAAGEGKRKARAAAATTAPATEPVESTGSAAGARVPSVPSPAQAPRPKPPAGGRPALKRVK